MILYCCNDSGPANYISSLILKSSIDYICIGSSISEKDFQKNGIKYLNSDEFINYSKIKLIITGTCLGAGIDKLYLNIGKQKGIKTIAIIEHWSLYLERFKLNNSFIYPDYIFLNDEIALKESINDGLPEDKLIISGNPYLCDLSKRKLKAENIHTWRYNNNLNDKRVFTFISESFKEDFKHNNHQGFDEYEVISLIMEMMSEFSFQLLIRKHPSETDNKYCELIGENVKIDQNSSFDSIIEHSDYIIGMGSIFLIEASMFRKDIISFRPNEKIEFIGNKVGLTNKIINNLELQMFIHDMNNNNNNNNLQNDYSDKTSEIINNLYYN